MIYDGIYYQPFAAICEKLSITFIDGLKIFFPNNKYVKIIKSDLPDLQMQELTLENLNTNDLLPHQIKVTDEQKYSIEDVYYNDLSDKFKHQLRLKYDKFTYDKRIKLGIYNHTTHDFLGIVTKFTSLDTHTFLCLTEIALTSSPANILANHVWIRFPSKFPRPNLLLGKPNKFRGRIYSYIKYDEYLNLEMTDYSIKPIER